MNVSHATNMPDPTDMPDVKDSPGQETPKASRTEEETTPRFAFAHLRHELRTPLNQIIGYTDLLLEDAEVGEQDGLASDLRKINAAGRRVLELINDILDPSRAKGDVRLDAGRVPMAPWPAVPVSERIAERSAAPQEAAAPGISAGTVLVVDDEEANRDMLRRRLERQGYAVSLAGDGQEALAHLGRSECDLVLLDLLMPGLDGFGVLERMKADATLRHIPVIVISALDDLESVVRCIEMGADDYLPKPFNPVLLRARVGASLEKKQLRDQERRLYAELEENYTRLRALERLRDDLTHMIVHDLRQPMTSFLSGLRLLEAVGPLNDHQMECLGMAVAGGEMLISMVNDLLDVGKMEAGALILIQQEIDIPDLVQEAVGQIIWLAREKRIVLAQDISPATPKIRGDREKLRRTLVNLLGNAVKFTPEAGSITISARRDGDEAVLSVRDTGDGIPEEAYERIFEKFGQVELRKEGRMLSTGLGLTFCKLVAEAHGGRIQVESQMGCGSTFTVTVPAQ